MACDICFLPGRVCWSIRLNCFCCFNCYLNYKPMPKYDPNAETPQMQLLDGDYPFEITKVEEKISTGNVTRGCAQRVVHMDFYADATFAVKVASIQDSLYDHPNCDWKYSVLARCVGYPLVANIPFDVDGTWRGYRGWAHCFPEPDKKEPGKKWNRVQSYITNGKPLPPRVITPDEDDNCPF